MSEQYTLDDLAYAFENAADFLDQHEFGGDNPERQRAANKEAERRIRRMAKRVMQ